MKILYGVQATGNGHIARARVMARAFRQAGIQVDYLLSGREPELLFGTEVFGDFEIRKGMTFSVERGAINYWKTALNLPVYRTFADIVGLKLKNYDLVLSDFEPITAWAAKIKGMPSLGISHQSAFRYGIPKEGENILAKSVMATFAPVKYPVGLHWSSFGFPILPPLIDIEREQPEPDADDGLVLVYLPFENPEQMIDLLNQCGDARFIAYVGLDASHSKGNVICRPYDKQTFQVDLMRCSSVICNAGFELPSECIHLGKRILVKPVAGQMEQVSNARALVELGLGQRTDSIDPARIGQWLTTPVPGARNFGDVAEKIVDWLKQGQLADTRQLSQAAWQGVDMPLPVSGLPSSFG